MALKNVSNMLKLFILPMFLAFFASTAHSACSAPGNVYITNGTDFIWSYTPPTGCTLTILSAQYGVVFDDGVPGVNLPHQSSYLVKYFNNSSSCSGGNNLNAAGGVVLSVDTGEGRWSDTVAFNPTNIPVYSTTSTLTVCLLTEYSSQPTVTPVWGTITLSGTLN